MLLRLATHAMGTRFELVLVVDGSTSEAHVRAAAEEAIYEIEEAHSRLSLFEKDSVLSHINRSAAEHEVRLDVDTYELLTFCEAVWRDSGGAFDPTVAPLMRARGFHAAPRGDVDSSLACVGWDGVRLDEERRSIRFERPGIELDCGGVGKGHGLDLAARSLREAGIERALLHGGTSTVVAIGAPPGESAWRVSLGSGAPAANLVDACLSVSAPHGRTVEEDGAEHGHVLDPRSGSSAEAAKRAAVIAATATLADAWSTALLVSPGRLPARPEVETLVETPDGEWRHATQGTRRFSPSVSPPGEAANHVRETSPIL